MAPFTRVVETERGGYLLRQHVHANLLDRLSQRPFLHNVERKWLAFQLLQVRKQPLPSAREKAAVGRLTRVGLGQALAQSHECGICHGDIKTENVVLTAWDWALLSDFAPFKPRTLPDDNSADFSFFFDTPVRAPSGRLVSAEKGRL